MVPHKSEFLKLSAQDLIDRRAELVASLGDLEQVLLGSLVEQTRKCGRAGCRCAAGRPHGPYAYLTPRRGKHGMHYVPGALVPLVAACLAKGQHAETILAEISAINAELLARRELGLG